MRSGVIAKKVGMTRLFTEDGSRDQEWNFQSEPAGKAAGIIAEDVEGVAISTLFASPLESSFAKNDFDMLF